MALNSHIFYNSELRPASRSSTVYECQTDGPTDRFYQHHRRIGTVVTGCQSNPVEARAVAVIERLLLASSISAKTSWVICLYRDQLYQIESALEGSNVAIKPYNPKRLNVALSRARDGMLIWVRLCTSRWAGSDGVRQTLTHGIGDETEIAMGPE
ncbi:hypothetical protein OSTOST_23127 [Ostertagia ostertagi]